MKSGNCAISDGNKTDMLKSLEIENAKLAYQALHLERVIVALILYRPIQFCVRFKLILIFHNRHWKQN